MWLASKILCELGYQVDSFEPDTSHAEFAKKFYNYILVMSFIRKQF